MTQVPPEPQYVARGMQISRGMKRFAWSGTVVIGGGTIALYDDKNQMIDWAPLDQTRLEPSKLFMGSGTYLRVKDQKYSLGWASGVGGGGVPGLVGTAIALGVAHSPAQEFIQAYHTLSGRSDDL